MTRAPGSAGIPRDDRRAAPGTSVQMGGNHRDDMVAPYCTGKPGDDQRTGPVDPVMTDDRVVPVDSAMTDDHRFHQEKPDPVISRLQSEFPRNYTKSL